MKQMSVTSNSGQVYQMRAQRRGFTFYEPQMWVHIWWIFGYWKTIEQGRTLSHIEREYPPHIREWYIESVNDYEHYQQAWSKYGNS